MRRVISFISTLIPFAVSFRRCCSIFCLSISSSNCLFRSFCATTVERSFCFWLLTVNPPLWTDSSVLRRLSVTLISYSMERIFSVSASYTSKWIQ